MCLTPIQPELTASLRMVTSQLEVSFRDLINKDSATVHSSALSLGSVDLPSVGLPVWLNSFGDCNAHIRVMNRQQLPHHDAG